MYIYILYIYVIIISYKFNYNIFPTIIINLIVKNLRWNTYLDFVKIYNILYIIWYMLNGALK